MSDSLVRIYESELDTIAHEVAAHTTIETGGSLLGLWSHGTSPTVFLASRPGDRAVRAETAFQQDAETHQALEALGLRNFGIQALGLWHSHHGLGLHELSAGDVERTMGIARRTDRRRFCDVLCYLANSRGRSLRRADVVVTVKPYVYTDAFTGERAATYFEVLPGMSPVRAALVGVKVSGEERARVATALAPAPREERVPYRLAESHADEAGRLAEDRRPSGETKRGILAFGRRKGEPDGAEGGPPVPLPDPAEYVARFVEPVLGRVPAEIVCELDALEDGTALRLSLRRRGGRNSMLIDMGWDGRHPKVLGMAVSLPQGTSELDPAKTAHLGIEAAVKKSVDYLFDDRDSRGLR